MQAFRISLMLLLTILFISACDSATTTSEETPVIEDTVIPVEVTETELIDTPESRGQALFVQQKTEVGFACASCHHLTEARLIGPGLGNLDARFESYELETTIEDYVLESIIHPQDYIVESTPEYPENVMPATYGDLFTEEQLNDLVAYILSL